MPDQFQDIKLLEFKYIVAKGNDAIIFEEVFADKNVPPIKPLDADEEKIKLKKEDAVEKKVPKRECVQIKEFKIKTPDSILENVQLSKEEIAEFMEFEKPLTQKNVPS